MTIREALKISFEEMIQHLSNKLLGIEFENLELQIKLSGFYDDQKDFYIRGRTVVAEGMEGKIVGEVHGN